MTRKRNPVVLGIAIICLLATFALYKNPIGTSISQEAETPNIFLKIDGIPGESTDSAHIDQIEIMAFNWGENQTILGSAGLGASPVKMRNFRFQASFSKASPLLFLYCASGKLLRYATLAVRTWAGSETAASLDYITWYFYDVTITSYDTKMDVYDSTPIDEFSISFGRIGVWYRQINADGSVSPPIKAGWDLRANRAWTPVPPSP